MDAASIEQMNKVRLSLGMTPLPVPAAGGSGAQFKSKQQDSESESDEDLSTLDKRQAAAGSNWQKLESERQDKVERQKRKDAAKKARDVAQKYAKLEGKGLGEASDDEEQREEDVRTYLKRAKKRQKEIEKARKVEEELAARERQMAADYTSKDLAGVKVGHEMDEFDDTTGEQILTLKDAEIGDESEEDELENADLKAKEMLEEKLKLKKKRPDYDPTEQEQKRNVLSKYDDEIDGKKSKRFTIDDQGNTVATSTSAGVIDRETKSKGVKVSLDMFKDDDVPPASDYLDSEKTKMKKRKKSKKETKTRVKKEEDDDDDDIFAAAPPTKAVAVAEDSMDVDTTAANTGTSKKRALDFEDDDDLQSRLAEQRRTALKKRKKMDAAELARQMREEMPVDEEDAEEGGLTLDETTEFVANLKRPEFETQGSRKNRTPQPAAAGSPDSQDEEDEDGDTAMATIQSHADADAGDRPNRGKTSTPAADNNFTATGLEDEDTISGQGLGASLSMLRKRGLIDTSQDEKLAERERQRSRFLAGKQHLIDDFDQRARQQREQERQKGTWDKMSNRERETYSKQQNDSRERYLNQLLAEAFKADYKPNVELRYTDEYGRQMSKKEAFKHMSHMFHGKGSGKGKTEKRLKRIGDERKEMEKGVLGLSAGEGGMREVQGREGRRLGRAGVRLQ